MALFGPLVSAGPLIVLVLAGSLDALDAWEPPDGPVAVVGSAAAFRGLEGALDEARTHVTSDPLWWYPTSSRTEVESLANQIPEPAWWLLLEGSPLHARSLWRHSKLAERWRHAPGPVVALGSSGSVLGEVMIDPRGGAPTTGVGLYRDRVVTPILAEPLRDRTLTLLGTETRLEELLPDSLLLLEVSE